MQNQVERSPPIIYKLDRTNVQTPNPVIMTLRPLASKYPSWIRITPHTRIYLFSPTSSGEIGSGGSADCGDKGFEPISYKHISIRLRTTTIPNGHVCALAHYTYIWKTTHPPLLIDGRGGATRGEDPEKPQATRRRGSRPGHWPLGAINVC